MERRGRMLPLAARSLLLWLGVGVCGAWLSGCLSYPTSDERFNDALVFTSRADNVDFSSFKTFAIDSTVHLVTIADDNSVEQGEVSDKGLNDAIVNSVASQLMQRGYQQVDASEQPQLGVTATAISGSADAEVTGGYFGGFYGSYWGFPGWSYYYPYAVTYSYPTGSLAVDMIDLQQARNGQPSSTEADAGTTETDAGPLKVDVGATGELPVVWNMLAYKAYVGGGMASSSDATSAIEQAFKQSPYLRSQ